MTTTEEKEYINTLVKKLKFNDEITFESLYKIMYKKLYIYLKFLGADDFTIEDVISSTFIIVYQKAKHKIFYKNCYYWILKISKYTFYNYNRKYKKDVSYELIQYEKIDISQNGIAEHLSLIDILNNLPNIEKQILQLKIYQGLTNKQISKILNISESTIIRKFNHIKEYIERNNFYE